MHVHYKRGLLRAGVVTAAVLPAVVLGQGAGMASTHRILHKVVNLINDPGAEKAKTSADGAVTVPGWTIAKTSGFTAVRYGTAGGFPGPGNHLPKAKGKWFFAGGNDDAVATASQIDSLAKNKKLISGKRAEFTLSAWLGGFSTQTDHATLTVTWLSGADKALGHTTIGPVTEAQRKGNTGLWFRTTSGKVPSGARFALVTLRMTREQGSYDDGYADNLSLTLVRSKR